MVKKKLETQLFSLCALQSSCDIKKREMFVPLAAKTELTAHFELRVEPLLLEGTTGNLVGCLEMEWGKNKKKELRKEKEKSIVVRGTLMY